MKKILEKTLDQFLRFRSFQEYVNWRFRSDEMSLLINKKGIYILDGFKYCVNSQLPAIEQVNEYDYNKIKPDDVIIDLGANIGAFTLRAAKLCNWVYAVEPLWYKELEENLRLNDVKNVTVLPFALGEGMEQHIEYGSKNRTVDLFTLSEILRSIERLDNRKITFMKTDCEGGEWYIKPEELKGIRHIEGEFHFKVNGKKYKNYDMDIILMDYDVTVKNEHDNLIIFSAERNKTIKISDTGWECTVCGKKESINKLPENHKNSRCMCTRAIYHDCVERIQ